MPVKIIRQPIRLLSWLLASCTLAGLLAELLGYHSIWGSNSGIFFDYFIPIPVATGTFHIPSLIGFAVAWMLLPSYNLNGRWNLRILALGIFGLALLTDWDTSDLYDYFFTDRFIDRDLIWRFHVLDMHGNPLMFFIMSDAFLFFGLSFLLSRPESSLLNQTRLRTAVAATVLILVAYAGAQVGGLINPPKPYKILGYGHPERHIEELHLFARKFDGSEKQTRLLKKHLARYKVFEYDNRDEVRVIIYTSMNAAQKNDLSRAVLIGVQKKGADLKLLPPETMQD